MTFLYPFFLWGLFALSIPIIIHLFNFRRAKKIYFSNVKFLENVKKSSSSKLKIKYLLVLFARLMFITFLVFAFAQPFISGKKKGIDSHYVLVYLDNSQSTTNLTAPNTIGLTTGIDYLNQIIELYPEDTKFKIITNDFAPSSFNYKSKKKALELVTELEYSNLSRLFQNIFNKIKTTNPDGQQKDIYFISDFQKSVFNRKSENLVDSINNYKIIPIKYIAHKNIFVDSIYLENPFLIANNINRLHVKIRLVGKKDVNELLVKLYINENQAATTSIDLPKETSQELVFDLNYRLENFNKCKITFEDFPVTFDNDYFFTLNLLKKIKIVEISGEKSPYLSSLFSENDLFSYNYFDEGSINFNQSANADLVIFNQLKNIDNSIIGLMADLKNAEKSIFIIPSANQIGTDISHIVGIEITKNKTLEKMGLDLPDLKNPFFEKIFESIDNKTVLPTAQSVISWVSTVQDILTFKTGLPFLSLFQSKGRVYLLGSPLQDSYTDLQKHALFVPIMYRMAALSSNSFYPLSYTVNNQLITLDRDSVIDNQLYKLSNATQELIPQQHSSSSKLVLDILKNLIQPGYYDLTLSGKVKNILAFNFTKKESLTVPLSREEIKKLFSDIKNLEILHEQNVETFTEYMKNRYEGHHLWKYALILSLIFLFIEVLLLRFL